MPKLLCRLPKYRKHRPSGQAVVTLDGRDHYLGPHGTAASRREYDRLVGEWQINGRRLPSDGTDGLTITELAAAYWRFAQDYYVKRGRPTDEQDGIKVALKFLRQSYRDTRAADFGPLSLENVRAKLVDAGHSRGYVNQNVRRICRMFKWGVSKELVPVAVHQALATVVGLRSGKTIAPDHPPVAPVDEATIQATLPHLPQAVADMVRFQRLTGCRPHEVCDLRPCDVDRTGDVWLYVPESHKMEHKGRERVILIGPQAQAVLAPYLLREADGYCFRPAYGKSAKYLPNSYHGAIERACDRAGLQRWTPNRLRHSAATAIRARFGLEAAQVCLGHAQADVTQVYAARDLAKAAAIMREVG
jgi:integrase